MRLKLIRFARKRGKKRENKEISIRKLLPLIFFVKVRSLKSLNGKDQLGEHFVRFVFKAALNQSEPVNRVKAKEEEYFTLYRLLLRRKK